MKKKHRVLPNKGVPSLIKQVCLGCRGIKSVKGPPHPRARHLHHPSRKLGEPTRVEGGPGYMQGWKVWAYKNMKAC